MKDQNIQKTKRRLLKKYLKQEVYPLLFESFFKGLDDEIIRFLPPEDIILSVHKRWNE